MESTAEHKTYKLRTASGTQACIQLFVPTICHWNRIYATAPSLDCYHYATGYIYLVCSMKIMIFCRVGAESETPFNGWVQYFRGSQGRLPEWGEPGSVLISVNSCYSSSSILVSVSMHFEVQRFRELVMLCIINKYQR